MSTVSQLLSASHLRQMLPALPRAAFDQAYHSWSKRHHPGNVDDPSYVTRDGRVYIFISTIPGRNPIHLHLLHTEILSKASQAPIASMKQWQVIAGRIGLDDAQYTNQTEGPMANPGVANQLRVFYKKYLQDFDNIYLGSVLASIPRQSLVIHPEDAPARHREGAMACAT